MSDNPLQDDLDSAIEILRPIADELLGARIFMTGGTGFVGCWLMETFAAMNEQLNLDAEMLVSTRRTYPMFGDFPNITDRHRISFCADSHALEKRFTHIIHAAPCDIQNYVDIIARSGVRSMLLTSSGAVYGPKYGDDTVLNETLPESPATDYGKMKVMDERIARELGEKFGFQTKIARMFAFVGPYLPLDRNFAIGNFIADKLAGRQCRLTGDGTPVRSYLYAMDMAVWLWEILIRGRSGRPYNVGSKSPISISQLAAKIDERLCDPIKDIVPEWYVPAAYRARYELDLEQWTPLGAAIEKTLAWHRAKKGASCCAPSLA